jgi:hypothetical protein
MSFDFFPLISMKNLRVVSCGIAILTAILQLTVAHAQNVGIGTATPQNAKLAALEAENAVRMEALEKVVARSEGRDEARAVSLTQK